MPKYSIVGQPDLAMALRIDMGAVEMTRRMMHNGFAVDREHFRSLSEYLASDIAELGARVTEYVPESAMESFTKESINIDSPDQIGVLLYQHLNIGVGKELELTKSGKRLSTGKKQLDKLKEDHPVIPLILQRRELVKLKNTYADTIPELARWDELTQTWRIHTTFGLAFTTTGRLNSKHPNCLVGDTELLTELGWCEIQKLKQSGAKYVAQWNPDGSIEFVKPYDHVEYRASKTVRVHSQHIDICGTADHRCPLIHRKTKEIKVYPLGVYPEDKIQVNAGEWAGGKGITELTDNDLRMLIAFQADGTWHNDMKGRFTFTKLRKIKRMRKLIKDYPDTVHHHRKDGILYEFYIHNHRLLRLFDKYLGLSKLFGPFLLKLSRRQVDIFLEEIYHWDGCFTIQSMYASKHKSNADWVQILHTLTGDRAVVRKYIPSNPKSLPSWQVDVSRRDYTFTTNRIMEQGGPRRVYCLSVPSTFIVTRRNGKTTIIGQCQNIPFRSEIGRMIRYGFVPSPGMVLISADYSQVELRLLAHCAHERKMLDIFTDPKGDIHISTACGAFSIPPTLFDKKVHIMERLVAKTLNFGITFDMQSKGLQQTLALAGVPKTVEECEGFIAAWDATYPDVRPYKETQYYDARRYGCVWTLYGFMRLIPEMRSVHKRVVAAGMRQAGNVKIQGTAAQVLKIAMAELEEFCGEVRAGLFGKPYHLEPLITVHDQFIWEADPEIAEQVKGPLEEIMAKCVELDVPLKVDSEIQDRWEH